MGLAGALSFPLGGPNRMVERYRDAISSLLPPGRGISKEPDANVTKLMEAIGVEPARLHARAYELLAEVLPTSAVELLDRWFEAFGSPSAGVVTTEDKRRAIAARLLRLRGHGLPHVTTLAAVFGYPAPTIARRHPFVAGSEAGDALTNDPWAHHLDVEWPTGDHDAALEAAFRDRLRAHATAYVSFV